MPIKGIPMKGMPIKSGNNQIYLYAGLKRMVVLKALVIRSIHYSNNNNLFSSLCLYQRIPSHEADTEIQIKGSPIIHVDLGTHFPSEVFVFHQFKRTLCYAM